MLPIPHLPPDMYHLPPFITRLELFSSEKPTPTFSSQRKAPDCLRGTEEECDGKSIDHSLVVFMEIEIQFQHSPACPAADFPV